MSRTESTMLPLGVIAPPFRLPDVVSGGTVELDDFAASKGLLVMFICRHCPYVKHVQQELAKIDADYRGSGIGIVAICSNDAEAYPEDGPEGMREMARELGFQFPYCFDETQDVARAYQAACTPDFFLFDAERKLVYRGQLDDSRPRNSTPVTGRDLRLAMDTLLHGAPVSPDQIPSLGCNIKWKPEAR